MRLFPEVIANFAVGCDGWDWEDDLWKPRRVPRPLAPIYNTPNGRVRLACPASVRLRFVSDTRRLRIALAYGEPARMFFQGVLMVDGRPTPFGPQTQVDSFDGWIFDHPARACRTFDLWLPHVCGAAVSELEADDGCLFEPAPALPTRWLAYGDSITQGMVASLPTLSVVGRVALALDAEVLNLAIGGAMMDARLADFIPTGRFDLITLAYGTNDFLKAAPIDDYCRNAHRLIAALAVAHPDRPIVIISPPPWVGRVEPNPLGKLLQDYRDALRLVVAQHPQATYVHGPDLVPEDTQWFVDGVHPNDEGFALYAQNLLSRLPVLV